MKPIILFLFVFCNTAFAIELKPLNLIINDTQFKDSAINAYILRRCAAAYTVMAVVFDGKSNFKKEVEYYKQESGAMGMLSMKFDKEASSKLGKISNDDDFFAVTVMVVKQLTDAYFEDVKKSQIENGNYFSEKFKDDVEQCKVISTFNNIK